MVDTPGQIPRVTFTYNGQQYAVDHNTAKIWRQEGGRWVPAPEEPGLRHVADTALTAALRSQQQPPAPARGDAIIPDYVPGAGAAPPTQPTPGGAQYPRAPILPNGAGPAAPAAPSPTAPAAPAPGAGGPGVVAPPPGGYPPVGTAAYDLWVANDMIRANGYNNWIVTGDAPVEILEPDTIEPANPPTKTGRYLINIRNPATNELKQITMTRQYHRADGSVTPNLQPGEDPKSPYAWHLDDLKDLQKADPNNKKGYSDTMTIGDTLYGTNNTTGAFEPVAGAPKIPVGWGTPQQIDDGKGHLVWMGIDPKTKALAPFPGAPTINKPSAGPGSVESGGRVYIKNDSGGYDLATGIPDPNPPIGTPRITLGPDGYLVQSTHKGNGQWDLDPTFNPVPFTAAAKAAAEGKHTPGEHQPRVFGGKIYDEYWDGSEWRINPNVPAKPMPGAGDQTVVSSPNEQEYITQRNPDTGALEPTRNPNWAPTDSAQRVRQLSQLANTKLHEIEARIGKAGYTQAQAQTDFDQWWDTNVEPAKQQMNQAQQLAARTAQQNQDLSVSAEQRAIQSQAQTAGQNAVANYQEQQKNMVGPDWGKGYFEPMLKSIREGAPPPNIPASAFEYQGYDYNQLAQYATAQALAHLSPTAASIMKGPGAQPTMPMVDYNQALNRTNYRPQGGGVTINIGSDVGTQQPAQPAQVAPGPGTDYGQGTLVQPFGAGVGAAAGAFGEMVNPFGAGVGAAMGQYVPR